MLHLLSVPLTGASISVLPLQSQVLQEESEHAHHGGEKEREVPMATTTGACHFLGEEGQPSPLIGYTE